MRSIFTPVTSLIRVVLPLFIVLLSALNVQAQLSGTRTISATGGDYPNISTAVSALTTQGVSGPVVFNIAPGTYNEQVLIGDIPGSSAVNTVTFQSQNGDSTSVIISHSASSTANYTLRLNNTDHVILRKLSFQGVNSSYSRVIELIGTTTGIVIENSRLIGFNTTGGFTEHSIIYGSQNPMANITIRNNNFTNGNYGVYLEGQNTSSLASGIRVEGNVMNSQRSYAIYLRYLESPKVFSNQISLKPVAAYGIYLEYCDKTVEILKNRIEMPGGRYGIYLYVCDGDAINRGKVINNFISQAGGTNANGIYLNTSTYQHIYHNSVHITSVNSGDNGAFYLTGGSNIDVRNNIFSNAGENYAYNVKTPSALDFSDYNTYYSNGPFLAFWGANREDLNALKASQSPLKDANSISFNPVFVSATDLHGGSFRIDNKGINLGVTDDIDGQTRTGFDPGADEFTGTGSALAAGTYTIGGASPNFTSISQAVNTLNNYGISGNVIFNLRNGTYNEQFVLGPVPGTGPSAGVVFQSESGDSTKVELTFNSGAANNYLVRFTGADYITFRKLSFTSLNTTYSRIFQLDGSSHSNTITSCILNANSSANTSDALIYSYESNINNLTISNNRLSGARYGVNLNPNVFVKTTGTKISNNTFLVQKGSYPYSIYLRNHDAPEITGNNITNSIGTNFFGIYLQDCINELKVLSNRISSNNTDGGISLYNCNGISTKRGLVANNFIDIGGAGNAWGIYAYGSDYQDIFHNTVRITSTSVSGGRAFYTSNNSSNLNLRNNLFTNFGEGYAYYVEGTSTGFSSDYNGIYSTGNYPVYWNNTNHTTLASYKTAASPQDAASISANPVFVSDTDLHARSSFVNNTGTPLATIITDIDGQTRSLSTPDLGADEFTPSFTPLAGGTYTIGGASPSYVNLTAAVNDLNNRGISGPVIFNLRNGSYNEQIRLLEINGSSPSNTIVFQSESGDSTKVEISFSGTVNQRQIVELVGTDHMIFRKLTFSALNPNFAVIFNLRGGIRNLGILNNRINGNGTTASESNAAAIYTANAQFSNLLVQNNVFSQGRSALWLESLQGAQSTGTQITGNQFSGHYYDAIYLKYHDAARVERNVINGTGGYVYFTGIYLHFCNNDIRVTGNSIFAQTGYKGINITYCTGITTKRGLIANNLADITGSSNSGIITEYSDFQQIYYNSVRINGTDASNSNAYYNTSGSNIDVRNNNFVNFAGGRAYYASNTTSIITSDHNNLFTTGNFLGYWNANSRDLSSFKTLTGKEANSISINPVYNSQLRSSSSFLNGKGTPLAAITTDIDGNPRNLTTPDPGANEFTPSTVAMTGTYTIGGTSPDFAGFTLAANALLERGVSGPVVFKVRNGNYNEQFTIFEIPGASAVNQIVFESESADSSKVILSFNASSSSNDYVVRLTGADHLTFRKMTIAGLNSSNSSLFVLNGNVSNFRIENSILNAASGFSGSLISSPDGNYLSGIYITANRIEGGGYGVYLNGGTTFLSPEIFIRNNQFIQQRTDGVRLDDALSPEISNNNFYSSFSSYEAIYLIYGEGKLLVNGNRIHSEASGTGITIYSCKGTLVNQGVISNNFITIGGNSSAMGINISYSEYQNILYNSVNILSTNTSTTSKNAFYLIGGDNNFVRNNIFSCPTGGYAYNIASGTAVDGSDFNNYFSTSDIAFWGSSRANLAALRTANGMDTKSLSVDPLFNAPTDLRPTQSLFHQAGTPLALVTTDIFGVVRDLAKPDIGAYEYFCGTPLIDLTVTGSCLGDLTRFNYSVGQVAPGTILSFDFDNDFNPDTSFTTTSGTISRVFTSQGSKTVNLIVNQIAGCDDYISRSFTMDPSPAPEIIVSGAYCGEEDGTATAFMAAPGTYSYSWSTGATGNSITGLAKGIYSVTVRNENNCIATSSFEVGDRIMFNITQLSPASCGQSNGSASVGALGGTEPYSYVWSNGETGPNATRLSTGIHYVNIIDGTGCSVRASVNIEASAGGPKVNLVKLTASKCFGEKNGSIDISVSGGVQPYTFQWSNGSVTEDISGLAGGIYDVLVTDNTGCQVSASFGVEQPVFLNVSAVVQEASCSGNDGRAIALAGGGTNPYSYQWSNGANGAVAENLAAGIYTLTLSDANNCSLVTPVVVGNTAGPKITTNSLNGVACGGGANGSIDISISGGTPLYTYSWLPGGQTTQDISGLAEGSYELKVTDKNGCLGFASFEIGKTPPLPNPICLVTVDSITGKNLLVWEKIAQPGIAFYNIYRESSAKGRFQLISSRPAGEPGEFLDEVADPSIRSWRYRISVVDNCGNESALSDAHKTIHLTQNVGLNRRVNLIWDRYEGFEVSTYRILRFSKAEGWRVMASIPGDLASFTDDLAPLDQELFYVIEVENPLGSCTTLKAGTYNTSRSNRQSTTVKSTTGLFNQGGAFNLNLYPNPASGSFSLRFDQPALTQVAIELIDARGTMVRNYYFEPGSDQFREELDIRGLPAGIYMVKISSDASVNYRKLVVQ